MTQTRKLSLPISIVIVIILSAILIFVVLRNQLSSQNSASGDSIPSFSLETFDPMPTDPLTFSNKDLEGKVVFVTFFSSWCPACVAEHPSLGLIQGRSGFMRLGIAVQDKDSALGRMLSKKGNPFDRIGADRDGQVSNSWGIPGLPQSFLVDKSGVIRYQHSGALSSSTITKTILPLIDTLLAEPLNKSSGTVAITADDSTD
ncbi:MAG: redoxin family protein [Alphaproteobacteria bacterium]|nr:redoxin family protein [Alphaproteobacteria bacterium]